MAEKCESNRDKVTLCEGEASVPLKNINSLNVKVNVDCSEALKGLKAVTRAAKKASAALKELDEVQRKVSSISITLDGKAIGGILTEHSEFLRKHNDHRAYE